MRRRYCVLRPRSRLCGGARTDRCWVCQHRRFSVIRSVELALDRAEPSAVTGSPCRPLTARSCSNSDRSSIGVSAARPDAGRRAASLTPAPFTRADQHLSASIIPYRLCRRGGCPIRPNRLTIRPALACRPRRLRRAFRRGALLGCATSWRAASHHQVATPPMGRHGGTTSAV